MSEKLQVENNELALGKKSWKERVAFLRDPNFYKVLILGQGELFLPFFFYLLSPNSSPPLQFSPFVLRVQM